MRQDTQKKEQEEKERITKDDQPKKLIVPPVALKKLEEKTITSPREIKLKEELKLKESPRTMEASSKKFGVIEKCDICEQTVYLLEKIVLEGKILHKSCLKCCHCGNTLSAGKYASLAGKYYCKPHFKQLFALKGNYSEGFGEDKPQTQWAAHKGTDDDT